MKNLLNRIPMPIVGVMLAFAALGNLIQSYSEILRSFFSIISLILFVITTLKFICNFRGLLSDLDNPIGASVFPTYSMSIILLAAFCRPYIGKAATIVWLIGILIHIVLLLRFTYKFVINYNIKQVFPSWFIVYVGIAVAAVTGRAFNPIIGQCAFWFALATYLILLYIVGKRVLFIKEIPEPALPTLIIFSAPGSLCLAGYLNVFEQKSMIMFWFLLIVSQAFYIYALIKLIGFLPLQFYPSYSGFTFPLVISAIALKASNVFLTKQGYTTAFLPFIVKVAELIAVSIVCYVFIRYINYIIEKKSA